MKQQTIFITGAEGVGKSSVLNLLKKEFPKIDFHDFDEEGVPINPPLQWRLDTTLRWIKKSIENQKKNISTCIVGLCFPNEIKNYKEFNELKDVKFFLLDINKEERKKRLQKRNASEEVIRDTECLFELKRQIKENVIDTSNLSIKEVFEKLKEVINK